MAVLNTSSPAMSAVAPNPSPRNTEPSSSASKAGGNVVGSVNERLLLVDDASPHQS